MEVGESLGFVCPLSMPLSISGFEEEKGEKKKEEKERGGGGGGD